MKRTTTVVAALAGIAAVGALALASGFAKRAAKRALRHWNSRNRFAMRVVESPFAHLAASQVGYGPSMSKQFSSAKESGGFRAIRERDGAVVFVGGAPVRSVKTDLLGAIDKVWIGDFSGLDAPARYRIEADNGDASFPFEIGPQVFDQPVMETNWPMK